MPLARAKKSKTKARRQITSAWARLEERLEGIGGPWCYGEILNLSDWKTVKYKETHADIIVLAEITTEATVPCKYCGTVPSNFGKWGFAAPAFVSDLPIRGKRVRIYFCLQRKRCSCKRSTLQQPLVGVSDRHAMTTRLLEYVQRESLSIFRTLSEIGDEVGRSEQTVRNILIKHGEQLQKERCEQIKKNGFINTPEWIAIDEVYPKRNGEQHCVISDPLDARVIDILPNNDPRALEKWLLRLNRDKVEVVSIDMWAPYRAVIRRRLPNARIVVDRYHVHNLLSVALKKALEVIRDSLSYSEQRKYMRAEFLLLKNYHCLSEESEDKDSGKKLPSERDILEKWCQDVPDIAKVHEIVKDFSDILQLTDRQKAEELTDEWLSRVIDFVQYFRDKYQSRYRGQWQDPFGNVAGTISDWRPYILNYIDFKKRFRINTTNAFAEFANRQIKKAYALGGYDYLVLRYRVVFGGILRTRRPPHPLDDSQPRSKRKHTTGSGKRGRRSTNPNSNLARLERAYEDEDVTRGLLDDPKENQLWLARFNHTLSDPDFGSDEKQQLKPKRGIVRRPLKHDLNQQKLF